MMPKEHSEIGVVAHMGYKEIKCARIRAKRGWLATIELVLAKPCVCAASPTGRDA